MCRVVGIAVNIHTAAGEYVHFATCVDTEYFGGRVGIYADRFGVYVGRRAYFVVEQDGYLHECPLSFHYPTYDDEPFAFVFLA